MSAERMKAAMAHYGLDYDDLAYHTARPGNPYSGWCSLCHMHYEGSRNRHCDIEKARREEMQEMGYACTTCFHCRHVYPRAIDRGGICPACKVNQDRKDAAVRLRYPRRFGGISSGVRVPDGAGCSEKVPRWMIDWDGNPEAGS